MSRNIVQGVMLPLLFGLACSGKSSEDTGNNGTIDSAVDTGGTGVDTGVVDTGLGGDTAETSKPTDSVMTTTDTGNSSDSGDTGETEEGLSSERYVTIASGHTFTCGVREDYQIVCWGESLEGLDVPPPAGEHSKVSPYCALEKESAAVVCWGPEDAELLLALPTEQTFTDVDSSLLGYACAVSQPEGRVVCWGDTIDPDDDYGQVSDAPEETGFVEVSTAKYHACGLKEGGEIVCWGSNRTGQLDVVTAKGYIGLAAGSSFTCGIDIDGQLACWGSDTTLGVGLPEGIFTDVDAIISHACAVDDTNNLHCWGTSGIPDPPLGGAYTQVSVGYAHGCAIRTDGRVKCWGNNNFGQASPP